MREEETGGPISVNVVVGPNGTDAATVKVINLTESWVDPIDRVDKTYNTTIEGPRLFLEKQDLADCNHHNAIGTYDVKEGCISLTFNKLAPAKTHILGKVVLTNLANDLHVNGKTFTAKELAKHIRTYKQFIVPISGQLTLVQILAKLDNFDATIDTKLSYQNAQNGSIRAESIRQEIVGTADIAFNLFFPFVKGGEGSTVETIVEFTPTANSVLVRLICYHLDQDVQAQIEQEIKQEIASLQLLDCCKAIVWLPL